MINLLPFQRKFLRAALAPGIRTAVLSLPRGNGKSALAGHLCERILTPGDSLFTSGTESVLCAASIEQARIVFRFCRDALEDTGEYSWTDSHTRIGVRHKATNTRLRVIGSNGRTAMGLVNCPWAILDEPGSWLTVGGTLLWDAVQTAAGKPNSPLRTLAIGTIAPSNCGWWADLIADGSHGSTHVTALQGDRESWDAWPTIRGVNPLMSRFPDSRAVLLEERDAARGDSRLRARFMSYRLNVPAGDDSEMCLTPADWALLSARAQTGPEGPPIVGADLGGGRAWSAACAVYPGGRIEAFAVAPGIPDLESQEKRDRVASGLYRKLAADGLLLVDEGLRVQSTATLWHEILSRWGFPQLLVADRFRQAEIEDASDGQAPLESRVTRWSEAAADIRALRKGALDGPFNVGAGADLLAASLSVAMVRNDDQGNTRLTKRSSNNTARDDVAAALVLAAGAWDRYWAMPPTTGGYGGLVQ